MKLAVDKRLSLRCVPHANIQVSELIDGKAKIGLKLLHYPRKKCVWGDKCKGCHGLVASFSIVSGVNLLNK